MIALVSDFDAVIELLGGDAAVGELCDVGISAVSNWRIRGGKMIPCNLYCTINDALIVRHGVVASDRLFTFHRRNGK